MMTVLIRMSVQNVTKATITKANLPGDGEVGCWQQWGALPVFQEHNGSVTVLSVLCEPRALSVFLCLTETGLPGWPLSLSAPA